MALIDDLKRHEGFRANVYKDSLGLDTVGYGFLVSALKDDELLLNGGKVEPMSEEVANKILELKIDKLKKEVFFNLTWLYQKPEIIKDALMNMAYQMGVKGLLSFKNSLALIQASEYEKAADNMLQSKWAQQTPNRAKEITDMIRQAS